MLLSGCVVMAFAACSDGFPPEAVPGIYVLERVGGEALPAMLYGDGNATVRILADTLHLDASRRGWQVSYIEVALSGSSSAERWESMLWYRIVGSRLELTYDCPPNALGLCAAPPHRLAWRASGGLRVEHVGGGALSQYYRRAAAP